MAMGLCGVNWLSHPEALRSMLGCPPDSLRVERVKGIEPSS
jgi:hypothetical protein